MSEQIDPGSTPSGPTRDGASTFPRGPLIIAGAILTAAAVLSLTMVALQTSRSSDTPTAAERSNAERIYLEARARAQDRAAQADLRNALVAAKTLYTDDATYAGADESSNGLGAVEPSLCYVGAESASLSTDVSCRGLIPVSVSTSADVWAAARMSESGTCFWVRDDPAEGTSYGSGLPCTGSAAVQAGETSW